MSYPSDSRGCGRLVQIVAFALLLGPGVGWAAPPGTGTGAVTNTGPGAEAPDALPSLLLVTEAGEDGDVIARAIETELNDVDVRLELASLGADRDLGAQIRAAEALVAEREALGVVWIEAQPEGPVVYLVVADAGMLRRPIVAADARGQAETVAIVVRHLALDLLAGRPVGLTRAPSTGSLTPGDPREASESGRAAEAPAEVVVDIEPPPSPTELLGDRGHFRATVAYVGQTWIRERGWEHGVEVAVGWRFAVGAHVDAGVGMSPAYTTELTHPGNLGIAQLQVRRYPVALVVGYQHVWSGPRLALDAQLRVIAEVIERSVFDPNGITPQLDRPVVAVPALEPRLALDYLVIPQLAVFAAVGVRTSLVRVDYRIDYTDADGLVVAQERPVEPRIVAPVVLLGLDMFF